MQFIVFLVVLIVTTILMIKAKSQLVENTTSNEPLSRKEKLIIWILCIFNPILAGAILYYGWKKRLPKKAKQANSISLWAFFIVVGLVFGIISVMSLSSSIYENDAKVFIYEQLTIEDRQRIEMEDVLFIIQTEFSYMQDKEVFDDKGVKYIQNEGGKNGKSYAEEDIDKVLDIEDDYLKSKGVEVWKRE